MATDPTDQQQPTGDFAADPRVHFMEATGRWTYTADDGIAYEYDDAQGAWFPMYNEQLIESQQSAYDVEGVDESEPVTPPENRKRRKIYTSNEPAADPASKKPKSVQPKKKTVTSVYVTGVPPDATVEEVEEVFSKCGVIMEDISTGNPKIKLYQDNRGNLKGDALVSYFKEESVALAVKLLDESEFRVGNKSTLIRVQQAVFKEKDPSSDSNDKKSATTKDKKRVQKKLHQLQRKLDWVDDETGVKADKFARIVILKHMFTHAEIEEDPALILELKDEVRDECEKLGEVTNVILYDKSDEGVVSVRFKEVEAAQACIAKMNGRFFGGRQVLADVYDGKTKYEKSSMKESEETEEEMHARLEKYAKWLESQEEKEVGGSAGDVSGSGKTDAKNDDDS